MNKLSIGNLLSDEESRLLTSTIEDSHNIIICCHTSPDGDAMGATLGWAQYLMLMGKEPQIIVPDQYPDFLAWLPNSHTIMRYDKHKEEAEKLFAVADLIFMLDFNDPSRLNDMQNPFCASQAKKILIDHHLHPCDCPFLKISHPHASSTCELVFRLIYQFGAFDRLDSQFAVPIYCGMMTDTGGFTYNSTSPQIFIIIAHLLTKGIDKDKIYRNVFNNYSENRLRLVGYVLNKKLKVIGKHVAYYILTRKDLEKYRYIKGDAEGLVNMALQIKGMRLSISLREDTDIDNLVHLSLRSVDDFPCNIMAKEFFNGGGHLNASGGRLHCSMEEAEQIVLKAIMAFKDRLQ